MKRRGKCENCGRTVPAREIMYEIRIDIYAKGGPVEIEPQDLEKDHIAEMNKLISEMEKMDADEITDQVWESYRFDLCRECREQFHAKLKLKVSGKTPRHFRRRLKE